MKIPDFLISKACRGGFNDPPLLTPFTEENAQPASYDVTLGNSFLFMTEGDPLDLGDKVDTEGLYREVKPDSLTLLPGQFVLASTQEFFQIPSDLQSSVSGKSSLGRLGLFVENAGFIDPGFQGTVTLELFNAGRRALILRKGMKIAQVSFDSLVQPSSNPYGSSGRKSNYQGQQDTTGSRWRNHD